MTNQEILKKFSLILRMGKIESGPPLSTILGNIGINSTRFCKELNDYVKDLPIYFLLEVKVSVFIDKTYVFVINEPSIALLLRLMVKKKEFQIKISGGFKPKLIEGVLLQDIILISFFKFGNCSYISLKCIYGTLSSLNLYVFNEI